MRTPKRFPRPRRRLDLHALALDAPIPYLPTAAGRGLSWPHGGPADLFGKLPDTEQTGATSTARQAAPCRSEPTHTL